MLKQVIILKMHYSIFFFQLFFKMVQLKILYNGIVSESILLSQILTIRKWLPPMNTLIFDDNALSKPWETQRRRLPLWLNGSCVLYLMTSFVFFICLSFFSCSLSLSHSLSLSLFLSLSAISFASFLFVLFSLQNNEINPSVVFSSCQMQSPSQFAVFLVNLTVTWL